MLSDFRRNDCFAICLTVNFFHYERTTEYIRMICHWILLFIRNGLLYPFLMILLFQAFIHLLKNDFQITDYPFCNQDIFIHLRCIYVKLQDFCILGKFLSISCHTVTESCSCYNQKITFTDSVIGCFCAMHSKHSGIQRIRSRECTFSHQGIGNRCVYLLYKFI